MDSRVRKHRVRHDQLRLNAPQAMLDEINAQAARIGRSRSWVVQLAWNTAKATLKKLPSGEPRLQELIDGLEEGDDDAE